MDTAHSLAERVKELTALHSVAAIMSSDDLDTAALLAGVASILPPAFQFPDVTAARLRVGAEEATTPGFRESADVLRSGFRLANGDGGSIEVVYTQTQPKAAIGPFLAEEQALLGTIGEMLCSAYNRRRAMAALRENEARMRFYASSTFEGIAVHANGKFIEVNDQFASMLGVPIDDLIGASVVMMVTLASREAFRRHLRERTGVVFAAKLQRADETTLSIEVRTTAVAHGGASAAVSVFRDITERTQLEEQLQRTQRLEGLGTLATGIAHDLNNVLAPVLLSVSVLQKRMVDPTMKRLIESLGKSANRGKEIVRQITTFARGSRAPFLPVQVQTIVGEMESFIRFPFGEEIVIRQQLDDALDPVLADATQLHQVLLNLCVNARDAMSGKGTLTIKAENVRVSQEEAARHNVASGKFVMLSVADTGPGIPAHIRDHIFEPFFSTKEIGRGTGLGLSTVSSIVRDHHGFITVCTEIGIGTELKVFLPVATEDAAEETLDEYLPAGNGEHILVVDDEQSILHIAATTLEAYDYRVSTASDGAEAIALMEKLGPGSVHLLLTDLHMRTTNGFETIRAIRAIDAGIRIVLSSGSLNDTHAETLASLHVDGHLNKPYTSSQMLQLLGAILSGSVPPASK